MVSGSEWRRSGAFDARGDNVNKFVWVCRSGHVVCTTTLTSPSEGQPTNLRAAKNCSEIPIRRTDAEHKPLTCRLKSTAASTVLYFKMFCFILGQRIISSLTCKLPEACPLHCRPGPPPKQKRLSLLVFFPPEKLTVDLDLPCSQKRNRLLAENKNFQDWLGKPALKSKKFQKKPSKLIWGFITAFRLTQILGAPLMWATPFLSDKTIFKKIGYQSRTYQSDLPTNQTQIKCLIIY